ncbi:type II toxin-antitoxin system VapC family toxin [Argonema antarcticum]|uniref:type II toxin-antitoxin system VapC family toxin n=1 Tax=Argonema antarcticum TaxID=2942763 RepID=UPI002010EA0B|nr:type II toxin-antitoxin system VapC family toxin [Argonema antarcticum]
MLDTNIVLYFLGGRLADPLPAGQYFVSVITEIELLSYPSISADEETQIRNFLTKITVVAIEANIKELTIGLRKKYRLRLPDAIIAATAQSLNATLLTNDVTLAKLTEITTQSVQIL